VKRYDSVDMGDAMRRRYFLACASMVALLFYCPMFGQVLQSAGCSVDLEILSLPSCAVVTKGDRLYVTPVFVRPLFKGIAFHLASRVLPDGGWAYFDRTGLVRVKDVAPFDNGASYFHSGLVRVLRDGKYGLASDRGILATPLYDGMNEFDKDHQGWKACNSCRLTEHGEYTWFEEGHWFWLDRRGRVAGPAKEAP
jgi:hypothetical protein